MCRQMDRLPSDDAKKRMLIKVKKDYMLEGMETNLAFLVQADTLKGLCSLCWEVARQMDIEME